MGYSYGKNRYFESESEDEMQDHGEPKSSGHNVSFESKNKTSFFEFFQQDDHNGAISESEQPFEKEKPNRPSRHRSTKSQTLMQPLILTSEGGSSLVMRHERFKNVISNSIRPCLSVLENTKFLERFRYLLVSSQLLDKQLSVYTMTKRLRNQNAASNKTKTFRLYKNICSCIPVIERRYWIGGGGCIIVIVVLLSWAVKANRNGLLQPGTPQHAMALIVITFGIALFLFAHSRRRVLRNLRTRILANTALFVENSQYFDMAVTKCISTIREGELMSRGYRPDLTSDNSNILKGLGVTMSRIAPPASRIENSATARNGLVMGKHLRSSVSAGLYLSTSACLNAVQEVLPFCNRADLEKYLEIYELDISVISEFGWERVGSDGAHANDKFEEFIERSLNVPRDEFYGSTGATASLQKIKFDLFKLHFLRRLFICCLLSVPTSGSCSRGPEIESWYSVDLHLETCSNLMNQLSVTLNPNRIMRSIGLDDPNKPHKQTEDVGLSEGVWQQQVRSLNHISSTLQHIEARMEILKDSSMSIINSASSTKEVQKHIDDHEDRNAEIYGIISNENEFQEVEDDFERNFDLIGNDIKALLSLWESGKKEFSEAIKTRRAGVNNPLSALSTETDKNGFYEDAFSPTITEPDLLATSATLTSTGSAIKNLDFVSHHRRQSSEWTSFSGATVLEGVSEHPRGKQQPSMVSRQERIQKMKQERVIEQERRAVLEERNNLVVELDSVLDYRRRLT